MGEWRERNRGRGIIGPLLLILLGVALLLDTLGIWSPNWGDIWRLWPLLLILAGLQIVFGRSRWAGLVSLLLVAAIVAGVLLLGPSEGGSRLLEEVVSHPAAGVTSAVIRADLGIGTLDVDTLEDEPLAFELSARYDAEQIRLTRDVRVEEGVARVRLGTTSERTLWNPLGRRVESAWRLRLNPTLPTELDVSTGVSRALLDLERAMVTRLTVNAGVGDVQMTLPLGGSYEVTVDGGIGSLRITIPEDAEARVRVDRGLGALDMGARFRPEGAYYVTAGYDAADERVEIDVDGGVGSITIR